MLVIARWNVAVRDALSFSLAASSGSIELSYISVQTIFEVLSADVWKRVGKYCDIAEWLQIPAGCKVLSGVEGEVGSVRSVANEVLVGKTELSYTYTQTVRAGRPYNFYHGTLEARPTPST